MVLATVALALIIAFLAAAVFYTVATLRPWKRAAVLLAVDVPILLSPLLVPAEVPWARFLVALNAVALFVKLYDFNIHVSRGQPPNWKAFAAYLPNWTCIVLRKIDKVTHYPTRVHLSRLARGLIGLAAGSVLLGVLFHIDWSGHCFALEHSVKVATLYVTIIPGSAVLVTLWRLAGGHARDCMDAPLLARTPADFWRRHNLPAQQFFYEDVFKPAGGLRTPIRAILVTFAVSALIHEYVFGITIGRVQGYQILFFLLQGCAVAATLRVKPSGMTAVPWMIATQAYNLTTSVLFFASVDGLFPFYSRPLPAWLDTG